MTLQKLTLKEIKESIRIGLKNQLSTNAFIIELISRGENPHPIIIKLMEELEQEKALKGFYEDCFPAGWTESEMEAMNEEYEKKNDK